MLVGTLYVGEVEALMGHGIKTKFFVFGGPLVPVSSHYVTHERSEHRLGGDSTQEVEGLEIPLYWKSVLLAWLRTWPFFIGALWAVFAWPRHDGDPATALIGPAALVVTGLVALFLLGRVPASQVVPRTILRRATGLSLLPQRLSPFAREDIVDTLRERWSERYGALPLEAALANPDHDDLDLIYAIASYDREPGLAARALERIVG